MLEVLGELADPPGQKRDLGLGRAGVGHVDPVLGQDGLLLLGAERHGVLLVVPVRESGGLCRRGPQQSREATLPVAPAPATIGAQSRVGPASSVRRMARDRSTSRAIATKSSSTEE